MPRTDAHTDTQNTDAVLTDGRVVQLRDLGPDDLHTVEGLQDAVSDRSLYLRYFSLNRDAARRYLPRLVRPNAGEHHAIGLFAASELLGVAAFERIDDADAEFSLLVADAAQHGGAGTLLLEHLVSIARACGVQRFVADVLAENAAMLDVLRHLGFVERLATRAAVTRVEFALDPTPALIDAVGARDAASEAASLRAVLAPRSIVVVGAGARPGTVGHEILANILDGGFTGRVMAVHPVLPAVLEVPAVASVAALPEAPDLAVIAVRASQVPDIVRELGRRGTRAAIVVSSGFGEDGPEGAARQNEILRIARDHGMRLVGPNCIGVQNTDPSVRLDATFGVLPRRPGSLALMAQSGAFGVGLIEAADRVGVGIAEFVSIGNKADVGGNDLLLAWENDPRVDVIAAYLESIGDPRRFAQIASRVTRRKPVLAVKSGRTEAGRRAGASHTAAAASPDAAVDALFAASGVQRLRGMDDLIAAARVLTAQPLPAGNRVAIIGNSGGPEILAADAASEAGLVITTFDDATTQALRAAGAPVANPLDLGAACRVETVAAVLAAVLASPSVDAVLTVFTDIAVLDMNDIRDAVTRAATAADKTIVSVEIGAADTSLPLDATRSLPVFGLPEPAAGALGVAYRHAEHVRTAEVGPPPRPEGIDVVAARRLVSVAARSGEGWLRPDESARLLGYYGIPVLPQRVVDSADEAVAAAAAFAAPVAVKLAEPGLHKTELDGVRLTLVTADEVRAAATELAGLGHGTRLLVQPMAPPGIELIVGAVRDPSFGPLVLVGAGGVLTAVLDDRTLAMAPVSVSAAGGMLDRLRSRRLLDGYRGAPAASRERIAEVVARVSALAADLPEIAELDLNPVVARGEVVLALDYRIRVAPAPDHHDPLARQLRGARA